MSDSSETSETTSLRKDPSEKTTLHAKYPKSVGFTSLLFLLGNAALQIYSHIGLSAVVKSNIDPDQPETEIGNGQCSQTDSDWWYDHGQFSYRTDLRTCSVESLFSPSPNETFVECASELNPTTFNLSVACANCYVPVMLCGASECGSICIGNQNSPECAECSGLKCNPLFTECTGFVINDDLEDVSNNSTTSGPITVPPTETLELIEVYDISFVSSVQDAYFGGAFGIALVVVIFSGIWPYAKNLIMFIAWFVPMRDRTRSVLLKNLTRLAKWSLVDVFAIVIILAGVRIDKEISVGNYLVVVAESRIAIYTFCVAAIWDLVQGEWMRLKHIQALEDEGDHEAAEAAGGRVSSILSRVRFKDGSHKCSARGRLFYAAFSTTQFALALSSILLPCIYFSIGGLAADLAGTNEYEYSALTIATSLLSPEALSINSDVPGTAFLVICYVGMSIVIPVFEYLAIMLVTLVPAKTLCCSSLKRLKSFCLAIDIIGGFACLDVFVLSFVVVTIEWDKLIDKAIGQRAQNLCPPGQGICLAMSSEIREGIYIMAVAFVLGWVLEMFFTYSFSQLYHPVEQVRSIDKFFNSVAPVMGCATENSEPHSEGGKGDEESSSS